MFLGEDILAWLLLAIGGALAVGTVLAFIRPQRDPGDGDLERPPLVRSAVMVLIGAVAAIWGIASLVG